MTSSHLQEALKTDRTSVTPTCLVLFDRQVVHKWRPLLVRQSHGHGHLPAVFAVNQERLQTSTRGATE